MEGDFLLSLKNAVITVQVGGKVKEKFMINLPNVRNLQGFLKGEWDLSAYDECFPKNNRLGDVDASIELNGHTLLIEFKESKHSINSGQILKAIRQAKYSNITTLFVFGKTNEPEEYLKFSPDCIEGTGFLPCSKDILHDVLVRWVKYTEENNLVENRTEEWEIVRKYVSI
jgi:hypothetical protein